MFCIKCGKPLEETAHFCPNCNQKTEYREKLDAQHPLTWYKFTIYFSLYATAVIAVINAILSFTGAQFGNSAHMVYSMYPGMKISDCIFGVISVAMAVYAIITRFRLAKFRKNAPTMFILIYVISAVQNVLVPIVSSLIMGQSAFNGITIFTLVYSLIVTIVCIICNAIYYKKRAYMFDK